MTKLEIEAVFARVRTWPADRQAYAAFMLLDLEREAAEPYELSAEELADLEVALAEEARGEFASGEEVQAIFNRLGDRMLIRFLPVAARDLESILSYVREDNPSAVETIKVSILSFLDILAGFSDLGRATVDRELRILRIRHARRRPLRLS